MEDERKPGKTPIQEHNDEVVKTGIARGLVVAGVSGLLLAVADSISGGALPPGIEAYGPAAILILRTVEAQLADTLNEEE